MRNLLGGKGCELAEMTNLGIPGPAGLHDHDRRPGRDYNRAGPPWPEGLWDAGPQKPRASSRGTPSSASAIPSGPCSSPSAPGARVSMPGMMETVLNLGLNDATVEGLAARTRNERFAWDCYRRFITMFGDVVLGIRREVFDEQLDGAKARLGVPADPEVPAAELRKLADAFKDIVRSARARRSRRIRSEQLRLAINAVFDSWFAKKADRVPPHQRHPRRLGHGGDRDGDGLRQPRRDLRHRRRLHARSPHGRAALLRRVPAQRPGRGRAWPASARPQPIDALQRADARRSTTSCSTIAGRLERHYKDMQDIEFTDAGGHALPAADPRRQALGGGGRPGGASTS